MSDPFEALDEHARARVRAAAHPEWLPPMLATLTYDHFSDDAWIFERKLDGVRALAFRDGDAIRLRSRNRLDMNGRYPAVVAALREQPIADFVVDGEVVAFAGTQSSFGALQQSGADRSSGGRRVAATPIFYYVFDVLHLNGHDVTRLPLRDRKQLLRAALEFKDPLRFTTERRGDGERYLEEACRLGWEGLIAKRAGAPYIHGRSRDWLKFKCDHRQEFVIGAYTDPRGSRTGFGALLLGWYRNGDLVYAGRVGTGFDNAALARLGRQLAALERPDSPFVDFNRGRDVHWVEPELVCEVRFMEWTRDGRLRHPAFLGMREDKPAREVTRERPA